MLPAGVNTHFHTTQRGWFNTEIMSYQHMNTYYKDKMVSWRSYLYNENAYSWKDGLNIEMRSLAPQWYVMNFLKYGAHLWARHSQWGVSQLLPLDTTARWVVYMMMGLWGTMEICVPISKCYYFARSCHGDTKHIGAFTKCLDILQMFSNAFYSSKHFLSFIIYITEEYS